MASGDTLITFDAASNIPPSTRGATFDTFVDASTPTTVHLVLDFDPGATTEFAVFRGVMPGQYDGTSALEVVLHWSSDVAGTEVVKWDVSWKSISDDDVDMDSAAFAAIQTVSATTASAAGEMDYAVIDFTNAQADGIQPNEVFLLRVERDSADAADTMNSNDAELHTVEVRLN
jgi:hypothetical protein